MEKRIPIFEFIIDDSAESGVKAISIVSDPAFESKFVTFGKEKPTFVELEKKKRICAGLSLIPDVPIYRVDEVFGEYFGYFSAETIEKIVEKYHEEMNQNKVNLNHDENNFIDAFLIEDYIVNSEARVEDLKKLGIEHQNIMGAWYTAFKIKDEVTFESILKNQEEGNPTGFSVEAFLDKVIVNMMSKEYENFENKMKKEKKTLLEKIIAIFSEEDQIFERGLVPELAIEIEWGEVGSPVQQVTVAEDGTESLTPIGPGEFVTDMGVVVVDDSSNLVEVREVPQEEAPAEEPMEKEEEMEAPEISLDDELQMPVEEEPAPEVPVEEPVEEPVAPEVKDKTIGEIVGEQDGEYYIKVVVADGAVTEAEVSSETNLLKAENEKLQAEKLALEEKLKEPIGDPELEAEITPKDYSKMSAYEKVMYRRSQKNK